MSLLALIPARGGSKRVRGKNVRKICGKPLLGYSIEAALDTDIFDKVIVSTEDNEIANVAREFGAEVPFTRPEKLASDEAQLKDVAKHALEYYIKKGQRFDEVMVLPPTSPLRSSKDIKNAYEKFKNNSSDFLIGVSDYRYTPVRAFVESSDGEIKPYWGDKCPREYENKEDLFKRSQEYPEFLADCASIYLVDAERFLSENTFHGDSCLGYYIPPERAIDIDDTFDLKIATLILEEEKRKSNRYDIFGDRKLQ